jgi:drug/metabolite transporter (DMT)-like permease
MLVIVASILLISLTHEKPSATDLAPTLPTYVPILVSMTVPVFFSANVMVAKVATTVYKANARDFTFGYQLLLCVVYFTISMTYFYLNPGFFSMRDFVRGLIGSSGQILGILCLNLALGTGHAGGPILAIV